MRMQISPYVILGCFILSLASTASADSDVASFSVKQTSAAMLRGAIGFASVCANARGGLQSFTQLNKSEFKPSAKIDCKAFSPLVIIGNTHGHTDPCAKVDGEKCGESLIYTVSGKYVEALVNSSTLQKAWIIGVAKTPENIVGENLKSRNECVAFVASPETQPIELFDRFDSIKSVRFSGKPLEATDFMPVGIKNNLFKFKTYTSADEPESANSGKETWARFKSADGQLLILPFDCKSSGD